MDRSELPLLAVLNSVAEHRGFRATGRALGISPSAVSHAIARLERAVGVRLLARNTRSIALTEAGQRLLDRLRPALAEIDAAIDSLDNDKMAAGALRITAPRTAVELLLMPLLPAFARAFPSITLHIRVADAFDDIVADGFDAGIRLGESVERDMIAVRLGGEQRLIAVATPAFLAARAPIRHPRDLAGLPRIGRRFSGGRLYHWEFEQGSQALAVAPDGPLIINDDGLVLEAARAGVGIAFVFAGQAKSAIANGDLVPILEDWSPEFPGFFLYYPTRKLMRPALRVFIDFIRHYG